MRQSGVAAVVLCALVAVPATAQDDKPDPRERRALFLRGFADDAEGK